jgi:hypothetical protein
MLHVDDGSLHAFLDGELSGAERDRVASHLAECAACRTRLEEERALIARAGALLARVVPPEREPAAFSHITSRRGPAVPVPLAWAATVALAFAVGWYLQGARLAHDLAKHATATTPEAHIPTDNAAPASEADSRSGAVPRRAGPPAPVSQPVPPPLETPPLLPQAEPSRQDAAGRVASGAPAPPVAAKAAALRDEAAGWPSLDPVAARALLGRVPALIPGRAVLRMAQSPIDDGLVLVEQEWRSGIVVRLYERRATRAESADQLQGAALESRPSARENHALGREDNLARYIGSLRVEIAGPVTPDSLSRLLDAVE